MPCLINYAVRDGLLRAEVRGKSSYRDAAWIARDIVRQTAEQAVRCVLIDVRRLAERLGMLGSLSMATGDPGDVYGYRVAVVDVKENDGYYARHEIAARNRGYALRCFTDSAEARNWLLDGRH
ncbi:MAG: hypothetical protein HY017_11415 [Betaproteobacteria bacterium]|nr:hypothetical protein [Betaproteobacteria bacterium]